jgi:hypothetical protein
VHSTVSQTGLNADPAASSSDAFSASTFSAAAAPPNRGPAAVVPVEGEGLSFSQPRQTARCHQEWSHRDQRLSLRGSTSVTSRRTYVRALEDNVPAILTREDMRGRRQLTQIDGVGRPSFGG